MMEIMTRRKSYPWPKPGNQFKPSAKKAECQNPTFLVLFIFILKVYIMTIILIDPREIKDSPFQPRIKYDDRAFTELVQSIKAQGILQPPKVREIDGSYETIFGHRRIKASIEAGKDQIEVSVDNLSDDEVKEAQVIENLMREEMTPHDEAKAIKVLLDHTKSPDITAAKIGKTIPYVNQMIALASLTGQPRKHFASGVLPMAYALELVGLEKSNQAEALDILLEEDGEGFMTVSITLEEFRKRLFRNYKNELSKAIFDLNDPELFKKAGACSVCPFNTAANTDLFGEKDSTNARCTKPACFKKKNIAHIKQIVSAKKKEGKKAYGQTSWDIKEGQVKSLGLTAIDRKPNAWKKVDDSAEDCKHTVFVFGLEKHRGGYLKWTKYCTNKDCTIHPRAEWEKSEAPRSLYGSAQTTEDRRAVRRANEKEKDVKEGRLQTMIQYQENITKKNSPELNSEELAYLIANARSSTREGTPMSDEAIIKFAKSKKWLPSNYKTDRYGTAHHKTAKRELFKMEAMLNDLKHDWQRWAIARLVIMDAHANDIRMANAKGDILKKSAANSGHDLDAISKPIHDARKAKWDDQDARIKKVKDKERDRIEKFRIIIKENDEEFQVLTSGKPAKIAKLLEESMSARRHLRVAGISIPREAKSDWTAFAKIVVKELAQAISDLPKEKK